MSDTEPAAGEEPGDPGDPVEPVEEWASLREALTLPGPAPRRNRSLGVPLLALAAGVLLVTSATFGVLAVRYKDQRDQGVDQRSDVATTAGELMAAMLDFDFNQPDATKNAVLDLASGDFASQYQEAAPAIAEAYQAVGATSQGTVRDVFVDDVSANGSASAIVFYDQVVSGTNGTNSAYGCYAQLTLALGPQKWTVTNVQLIGCISGDVNATPGAGGTVPTTTVPPTSTPTP